MQVDTQAIVCSLRVHGEHGAVVRLLTPDHGLVAAYVRGARGRRLRPLLIPGNVVAARFRWRTENQLPQAEIELVHSRAPILSEPLPLAAVEWVTALVASALPERQPYPALYQGMAALLDAIEAAPSAKGWSGGLARFEQLLIAELGYEREEPASAQVLAALETSGDQLFRDVLSGPTRSLEDSRVRLVDRLRRALV
ncbi:DNA repair protein RecO [Sphingomonas sabuli]|uniref:DNA repair protein RecO n=1 Tax=Sphingomonas sabuli TaxID=2764186 RepID=A0A7G9L3D7_9SPHN|nr:DNA repair protein RecO [Sphingomonas sabuli]QNM83136.1 DNA repair protein RecO [Sphingomonas sabuli]